MAWKLDNVEFVSFLFLCQSSKTFSNDPITLISDAETIPTTSTFKDLKATFTLATYWSSSSWVNPSWIKVRTLFAVAFITFLSFDGGCSSIGSTDGVIGLTSKSSRLCSFWAIISSIDNWRQTFVNNSQTQEKAEVKEEKISLTSVRS